MIECENVCLTYRKKTILQGASLTARPGQITALLGKNGSGKSSLARCIAGARHHCTGTILLNGRPSQGLSPNARAKMCIRDRPNLNDLGIVGQRVPQPDLAKCRGCKVCQVEKACPIHVAKLADGKLAIPEDACNHCGRCLLYTSLQRADARACAQLCHALFAV